LGKAAFHGVALAVAGCVEGGRAASALAAGAAVVFLVFFDRDDRLDAAAAQVGTVGRGRVGLVTHRGAGPGAGPPGAPAGDLDLIEQRDELGAVAVLAGGEDPGDRPAAPVSRQVDLGGQAAAGAAQRLPARRILVIRHRPLWPVRQAARGGRRRRAGARAPRWSPR